MELGSKYNIFWIEKLAELPLVLDFIESIWYRDPDLIFFFPGKEVLLANCMIIQYFSLKASLIEMHASHFQRPQRLSYSRVKSCSFH